MRWASTPGLRRHHVDREEATASMREIIVEDHGRLVRQAMPKTTAGFRTVPLSGKAMDALKTTEDVWGVHSGRSAPEDGMHAEELTFKGAEIQQSPRRRESL